MQPIYSVSDAACLFVGINKIIVLPCAAADCPAFSTGRTSSFRIANQSLGGIAMPRPFLKKSSRQLLEWARLPSCSLTELRAIAAELAERKNDVAFQAYLEVGGLLQSAEAEERRQVQERQRAERQQALRRRSDGFFDWPSTDAPASIHGYVGDVFHYQDGLLRYVGYSVGRQGEPQTVRRQILDCVFHNVLPRVQSPEYMADWNAPTTAARLQKIAESIAAFARNAKRNARNDYSEAIADWESDLEYLFHEYYVRRFGFAWPDTQC